MSVTCKNCTFENNPIFAIIIKEKKIAIKFHINNMILELPY